MYKEYRLPNGFKICKGEIYEDYFISVKWCIWAPDGELYGIYDTYNEALEIARDLKSDIQLIRKKRRLRK